MGGPFPYVALAEAREAAARCRAAVRQGADPIDQRRQAKAVAVASAHAMTFRQVADKYLTAHARPHGETKSIARNGDKRSTWRATKSAGCLLPQLPQAT